LGIKLSFQRNAVHASLMKLLTAARQCQISETSSSFPSPSQLPTPILSHSRNPTTATQPDNNDDGDDEVEEVDDEEDDVTEEMVSNGEEEEEEGYVFTQESGEEEEEEEEDTTKVSHSEKSKNISNDVKDSDHAKVKESDHELEVGSKVQCRYKGRQKWYHGTITEVHDNFRVNPSIYMYI
jgi:hypothetical protein